MDIKGGHHQGLDLRVQEKRAAGVSKKKGEGTSSLWQHGKEGKGRESTPQREGETPTFTAENKRDTSREKKRKRGMLVVHAKKGKDGYLLSKGEEKGALLLIRLSGKKGECARTA